MAVNFINQTTARNTFLSIISNYARFLAVLSPQIKLLFV